MTVKELLKSLEKYNELAQMFGEQEISFNLDNSLFIINKDLTTIKDLQIEIVDVNGCRMKWFKDLMNLQCKKIDERHFVTETTDLALDETGITICINRQRFSK